MDPANCTSGLPYTCSSIISSAESFTYIMGSIGWLTKSLLSPCGMTLVLFSQFIERHGGGGGCGSGDALGREIRHLEIMSRESLSDGIGYFLQQSNAKKNRRMVGLFCFT